MLTEFTLVYKRGNEISTWKFEAYSMTEALEFFNASHYGNAFHVLAVMPTEVFEHLPDASVFFGIFPY